jgi:hypothetical protein
MGCSQSRGIDLVIEDAGDAPAAGWQTYVDVQLVGVGCAEGLILGNGGELWAKSTGISIKSAATVTVRVMLCYGAPSTHPPAP